MLRGKKIIIGVTAGIAAYKTNFLVRLLIKSGAEVRVVMTPDSLEFVTPLTFSTLSKNPVWHTFKSNENGQWNNHVDLGIWADLFILAPCTANTISKMSHGVCDNILMAVYLSAKCPVWIAPAMDLDMYSNESTQKNLQFLSENGIHILPAGTGELASGLSGEGRMMEPEEILNEVENYFSSFQNLEGKKILITAGPTYEAIDPVRFIGNHSSGKMGFELALAAARMGAQVQLISGPTSQKIHHPNIKLSHVVSAGEMHKACSQNFEKSDIVIMAAAVADYTPVSKAKEKIKKKTAELTIQLKPTVDILREMGSRKKKNQFLVGFALETENEKGNASRKLKEKNLDLIVLNSLKDKGAGFGHSTNKISVIGKNNKMINFELKSKREVAVDILKLIAGEIK
jgi:phosphopantothenoylcysteine decarboxylase/phosphopantothenate--cysteine ligase